MPNLLIGGDTNLIFDPSLDRRGNAKYIPNQSDFLVEQWMTDRDLVDMWRVRNPNTKR